MCINQHHIKSFMRFTPVSNPAFPLCSQCHQRGANRQTHLFLVPAVVLFILTLSLLAQLIARLQKCLSSVLITCGNVLCLSRSFESVILRYYMPLLTCYVCKIAQTGGNSNTSLILCIPCHKKHYRPFAGRLQGSMDPLASAPEINPGHIVRQTHGIG